MEFGLISCPDGVMFSISGLQDDPEPEPKVGSPQTPILDLSTIVQIGESELAGWSKQMEVSKQTGVNR